MGQPAEQAHVNCAESDGLCGASIRNAAVTAMYDLRRQLVRCKPS